MYVFDRTGLGVTYLDGVRVDSRAITNLGDLDTGNVFNIGQDPTGYYPETAAADIDDLGIRRRALTEYQALSIFGAAQNGCNPYLRDICKLQPAAFPPGRTVNRTRNALSEAKPSVRNGCA